MPLAELKGFLSECGDADFVQLRFKNSDGSPSLSEAGMREAIEHAKSVLDCPIIVNDLPRFVSLVNGIHVGQGDEQWWSLKKDFPNKIVGLSIGKPEHLDKLLREHEAHGLLPDYLGVGAVFQTNSKRDAHDGGIELLKRTRSFLKEHGFKVPVIAIGGITPENAAGIRELCDGVAAISVFKENPRAAIREFKERS
jgi:thiamine-phosphate pyrophosphorylase